MRRFLAGLAALLMVAGGFVAWAARTGRLDNGSSTDPTVAGTDPTEVGGPRLTIACIPELETFCGGIGNIPDVGFDKEPPLTTESQIAKKSSAAPDGWITTALGYERVRFVNDAYAEAIDVGSTAVVVVTRANDSSTAAKCKADLGCLATAPKVAFPSATATGMGLSIVTAAAVATAPAGVSPLSIDDLADPDTVSSALRTATKYSDNQAFTNLTSVRLLDAVVASQARVNAIQPAGVTVTPTSERISIVLMLSKSVSESRAKEIAASIRKELTKAGFDEPEATRRLPNASVANDLLAVLR